MSPVRCTIEILPHFFSQINLSLILRSQIKINFKTLCQQLINSIGHQIQKLSRSSNQSGKSNYQINQFNQVIKFTSPKINQSSNKQCQPGANQSTTQCTKLHPVSIISRKLANSTFLKIVLKADFWYSKVKTHNTGSLEKRGKK